MTVTPSSAPTAPHVAWRVLGGVALVHLAVVAGLITQWRDAPSPAVERPVFVRLIEAASSQPPAPPQPAESAAPPPPVTSTPPEPREPVQAPSPVPARAPVPAGPATPTTPQPATTAATPNPPLRAPARTDTAAPERAVERPATPEPTPPSGPVAPAPAPREPAAAAPVTPPLFKADYLDNPEPPYPASSQRMGEEGVVTVRVLVDPAGKPAQIELARTSGFPRLDRAALDVIKLWRFVPARQGDQPIAAWVVVPVKFEIRS